MSGRDTHRIALVEAYLKAQGMFREAGQPDPIFTDMLELDLSTVQPSMAGPSVRRTGYCSRMCLHPSKPI